MRVSHLTKSYNDSSVIKDFSAVFPSTGFFLLFGESGSGKTTFLNLLAGFLQPDQGTVEINGRDIPERTSSLPKEMDYITQDNFFADYLNVEDNLRLLGTSKEEISQALARFGLNGKEKDYPQTLSGGERARLALVRSLLKGKSILLLDEPTAALDVPNKQTVFEALHLLGQEVLVFCASHDAEAVSYAEAVLRFSKGDPTPQLEYTAKSFSTVTAAAPNTFPDKAAVNPPILPYIRKWFSSERREVRSRRLFFLFLVLSILFLLFADTSAHKQEATCKALFGINAVHLSFDNGLMLKDLCLTDETVKETVVHYHDSCPFEGAVPGRDDGLLQRYDLNIFTLPEDAENFRLSSALSAGSYFTAPNQMILSAEMAERLSPGDPAALIGQTITRRFFKYGTAELTIVGVFREFTASERAYMNSCGADYNLLDYEPENYRSLFFINAALVNGLLNDEDFYRDNGHRSCFLFFDSYADLKAFLKNNQALLSETKDLYAVTEMPSDLPFRVEAHSKLLLPLALLISAFTVIFFAELNRTEFLYNHDFVSAFEYAGYPKQKIIHALILSAFQKFLLMLTAAVLSSFLLALLANNLNHCFGWFALELFSIEPWIMAAYLVAAVLSSYCLLAARFRRVQVTSWYENLLDTRDVL